MKVKTRKDRIVIYPNSGIDPIIVLNHKDAEDLSNKLCKVLTVTQRKNENAVKFHIDFEKLLKDDGSL